MSDNAKPKFSKDRLSLNRYYFGVVIPTLVGELEANYFERVGVTEAHKWLSKRFSYKEEVKVTSDYEVEVTKTLISTRHLDLEEFRVYCNLCSHFINSIFNTTLPYIGKMFKNDKE